jgi:hypothetical protein
MRKSFRWALSAISLSMFLGAAGCMLLGFITLNGAGPLCVDGLNCLRIGDRLMIGGYGLAFSGFITAAIRNN